MANKNDVNTPTKVPCGGFMLGEGLALGEDGKTLNVTGQADWNQNDETAADYIKNKPVVVFTENSNVVSCNCSYEKFKEIVESGQAFVFYIHDSGDGAMVLQSSQVVVSNSNNAITSTFSMVNGSSALYASVIYRSDGTITDGVS